jgi:hypothetical protein
MVQRVQVLLFCDLHDGEAAAAETVRFSLNGKAYEIDVCDQHAAALRDAFAPFVGSARRVGSRAAGPAASHGGGRRRGSASAGRAGEIRDWARAQGIAVSERGRIPADVAAKYDAEH